MAARQPNKCRVATRIIPSGVDPEKARAPPDDEVLGQDLG
jgi:hypothetical protein